MRCGHENVVAGGGDAVGLAVQLVGDLGEVILHLRLDVQEEIDPAALRSTQGTGGDAAGAREARNAVANDKISSGLGGLVAHADLGRKGKAACAQTKEFRSVAALLRKACMWRKR